MLLCSTLVHAAPTQVSAITIELPEEGAPALTGLVQITEEPGGLAVPIEATAELSRYGLLPGDVIRAANGSLVFDSLRVSEGTTVLEVIRQHKPLLIKIVLRGKASATTSMTHLEYLDLLERLHSPPYGVTVLRGGKPSGVRVTSAPFTWSIGLADGDIVRAIDGHAITTDSELMTAVTNLRVGVTRIVAEHEGRPLAIEVTHDKPVDTSSIHAVSATRYELARDLVKTLTDDTGLLERHVDAVRMRISKTSSVSALELVNVQPDSLVATLGLETGDLLFDINGFPVETIEKRSKAMDALLTESIVTLHLERKGKRIAISYALR